MRSLRQVSCVLPYQLLFLLLERRLTPFVPLPLLSVHRSVIPPFESITPFHTRAQPPRFDQTVNESLTFLLFFLLRLTPPSCSPQLFLSPSFPLSPCVSNSPSITRATESQEQMLSVQPPCPIALCASPLLPPSLPRSSSSHPSRGSICSPPREANVCFLLLLLLLLFPSLSSFIPGLFFWWGGFSPC